MDISHAATATVIDLNMVVRAYLMDLGVVVVTLVVAKLLYFARL